MDNINYIKFEKIKINTLDSQKKENFDGKRGESPAWFGIWFVLKHSAVDVHVRVDAVIIKLKKKLG